MDDIALYDLPAIIETIEKTTGRKGEILFIGHSLGSTIALMYASEYPEAAKEHIRFFLFMSPAYTLTNMISPMKGMGPIMNQWLVRICKATIDCCTFTLAVAPVCLVIVFFHVLFAGTTTQIQREIFLSNFVVKPKKLVQLSFESGGRVCFLKF